MSRPYLSIVVAVCDDEYGLTPLMERLYPVLQGLGRPFEIIFSNDGSRDNSEQILLGMAREYPGVRIIELSARFGRQMAFLAAFGRTRGEVVVTMAADLSDPPEEIPRLVAEIERGRGGAIRGLRPWTAALWAYARLTDACATSFAAMASGSGATRTTSCTSRALALTAPGA